MPLAGDPEKKEGIFMRKQKLIVLGTIAIFAITGGFGCQQNPTTQSIVGQGGSLFIDKINATPIAPSKYEVPGHIDDEIELNTCTFHVDADVEIFDTQKHPVLLLQRETISEDEFKEIMDYFIPDVVGERDAAVATKEELTEQIMLIEQGVPTYNADGTVSYRPNQFADSILPEYYDALEKAPYESFITVEGDPQFSMPMQRVYMLENDERAYCYFFSDAIMLYPNDYGNIQKQSWLIEDGGWEGEGPVTLTPTVSKAKALDIGARILQELGFSNMQLASIEAARMLDGALGYNTLTTGWYLTYTSSQAGGVPFDADSVSTSFMQFADDEAYAPSWPQEKNILFLDETGIRYFSWESPYIVAEVVNTNVELLPFDTIYERAEALIKQGFAWTDQTGTLNEDFVISRILLTYYLVPQKNSIEYIYWMPTWVFVYQKESDLDNSVLPGYIAINAIDGSRVELFN